jgi:hypothetical protein
MEDTNIYSIIDLDGYASSIRDGVAQSFVENYEENLDEYITIDQVKNLIIGYSLGQDEDNNYLINAEVFNDTFDDVREWFYEAGLSKLAAKGVIECAWDDNEDRMIFWVKDNEQQSNNTTETGNR